MVWQSKLERMLFDHHHCTITPVCVFIVQSVPVKLLHEGEGHVVTVELKSAEIYRGMLVESEDTMNLHLSDGESCPQIHTYIYIQYPFHGE